MWIYFYQRLRVDFIDRHYLSETNFCEAERSVLGFTHPEVGACLAESWSLPDSIIRCIRHHHDPAQCDPPEPLVDAVHLADSICLVMGVGGGDDGLSYRACPEALTRYDLTATDMETLGADLIAELRAVQTLFENT